MTPTSPSNQQSNQDLERLLGQALGPEYDVRGLLGRGGFAEVYEVWDRALERRLAVKVLRPDVAWTSGMLARFRQEARAVARLTHPNILPIHFVGEGEGIVYYAMPFVEGRSLGDLLRSSGALDVDRILTIIRPVLEALHHAHQQGFLHRDIKPDNVMIEEQTGRVLLMDFGIVKRVDGGGGLTQTGFVVGTPYYMSPEQALGQADLDARSDLYSLGAMLYQMATGSPPFEADSSQEIVAKHISEPPPIPAAQNTQIPQWLSDVIVRCLAKRPVDRYESAAAMLEGVTAGSNVHPDKASGAQARVAGLQGQSTTPIATPSGGSPPPLREPRRGSRRRHIVLGVFALMMVSAGVAVVATRSPTLVVENRLVTPVRVSVGDHAVTVRNGAQGRVPIPRGRSTAQWAIVRPTTPGGNPLGVQVEGVFRTVGGVRPAHHAIEPRAGGRPYFAPLVSNGAGEPVSVTVNAGLVAVLPCGCRLPPGLTRAVIGYYPLFSNSSVEVRDASGRRALYRDIATRVDPSSGVVEILVTDGDFKRE